MKDFDLYYINGHKYLTGKFDKVILPVGSVERHDIMLLLLPL